MVPGQAELREPVLASDPELDRVAEHVLVAELVRVAEHVRAVARFQVADFVLAVKAADPGRALD